MQEDSNSAPISHKNLLDVSEKEEKYFVLNEISFFAKRTIRPIELDEPSSSTTLCANSLLLHSLMQDDATEVWRIELVAT